MFAAFLNLQDCIFSLNISFNKLSSTWDDLSLEYFCSHIKQSKLGFQSLRLKDCFREKRYNKIIGGCGNYSTSFAFLKDFVAKISSTLKTPPFIKHSSAEFSLNELSSLWEYLSLKYFLSHKNFQIKYDEDFLQS